MKRILTLTLVLLLAALLIAACGGGDSGGDEPAQEQAPAKEEPAPAPASTGDPIKGKELFSKTCQACHGEGGVGVEGLGKDMTHSTFIAGLTDEEFLAFVKTGRPTSDPLNTTGIDMPPKGGNPALSDEQIMDIIAYIRTIHQ